MGPPQGRAEGEENLPRPAGHTPPHAPQNGARRLCCLLQRSENERKANAGEWEAGGSRVSLTGCGARRRQGPSGPSSLAAGGQQRPRRGPRTGRGRGQMRRAAGAAQLLQSLPPGMPGHPASGAGKPNPAKEPRRPCRHLSPGQ